MKDLLGKERYCYSIILYFTNEKQKLVLPHNPLFLKENMIVIFQKSHPSCK